MHAVRTLCILAAAIAPLILSIPVSAAEIAANGEGRATIVVGPNASKEIRDAANDLRAILQRVSGAALPIVSDAEAVKGTRILVGVEAAAESAKRLGITIPTGITNSLNEEGYAVIVDGDTIILAGNEIYPYRGTPFAVYDLLHAIGCRWFMPGQFGEALPHLPTVRVEPQRRIVRPEFRIRNIWYSGWMASTQRDKEEYEIWKLRNRMCRPAFVSPDFLPIPGDDTAKYLLPKEKYWSSHPEYYALNPDGTRNPGFLCMSNAGAFEAATGTIVERFTQNPALYCFSFSPPDAPSLCSCPDCTKATHGGFGGEGWGEISDAWFDFVMRTADKIAERCPGKWVTSMAYYNRCRPPISATKRRDNLIMYMAAMQQCPVHSYGDATCWSRSMFKAMLRRWSELSAGVVLYEYDPHDWSMLQYPTWRSDGIADDYRFLKQIHGWGFNDEGQIAWIPTGLNYYVRARLAWNVEESTKDLERDFCTRFFGPAAEPMLAFYGTMERAMRATKIDRPRADLGDFAQIYTRPVLDRCLSLLDSAASRADRDPYRRRVAAFRALLDRIDAYQHAHEAIQRGDYAAVKQFAEKMISAAESVGDPALLADHGPIRKGFWSGAGLADYAQRMGKLADGTGDKLIATTPSMVPFHVDPAPEGIMVGWYEPGFDDAAWPKISTAEAAYTQGVTMPGGLQYSGISWYRIHVKVSEADAHGPARLLLPFYRSTGMTIWCNGVFADQVTGKRMGELIVDVTGILRSGENVIAIRTSGEGGLVMPPLLYAPSGAPLSKSR